MNLQSSPLSPLMTECDIYMYFMLGKDIVTWIEKNYSWAREKGVQFGENHRHSLSFQMKLSDV